MAIIARRPSPLKSRRLHLELAGSVEQRQVFVDLEECAVRTGALQEAGRAAADADRVAVDQLVVECLLHDLAEQRDHRVDRRIGQWAALALVGPTALVGHLFHQGSDVLAVRPRLGRADRFGLLGELVAEPVDQSRRDLVQAVAAEEPLQVAEPPFIVVDGGWLDPQLLGAPPALGKYAERLVILDAELGHLLLKAILARLQSWGDPCRALDLLDDPFDLKLGAGAVPALLVGAERDLIAAIRTDLSAVADGHAIRPGAFQDVS